MLVQIVILISECFPDLPSSVSESIAYGIEKSIEESFPSSQNLTEYRSKTRKLVFRLKENKVKS